MPRGMTPTELEAALRKLGSPEFTTKALRKEYRKVGTKAAGLARSEMRAGARGGARVARAAPAVRGSATARGATLSMGGKAVPGALAAIWGTKKTHTGWAGGWENGAINPAKAAGMAGSKRNTLEWIGDGWTVATAGQGPRGVNDALAKHQPQIEGMFLDAAMEFMGRAFPHGFN